jgi:phage-related protein (TIGR01555 family)
MPNVVRKDGTVRLNRQEEWLFGRQVEIPQLERVRCDELVRSYKGMIDGATARRDGWLNALTGVGDPLRDKMNLSNQFLTLDLLSQTDCEIIWRSDDVAAKAVEKVPEEMTRQGWSLKIEDDCGREIAEVMEKWAEELDLLGKAKEALEYARAYGGAGIFLGVDDGQKDLTKPLDVDKVKTFRWMNVLTPLELFPRIWYGDPHAPKYGEPLIYRIQRFVFGGAVETGFSEKIFEMPLVHESRIIRVDGIRVSRRHLRERNGWGDSILQRMLQVISDFQQAYHGVAILTSDFAQAVLKINNLAELVSSQNKDDITARAAIIDMSRSIARAIIIDKDEEFERKATPVGGLDKLLEQLSLRLASTVDMPVSLLMGQSPAGLNATGDADIRWFYDRIKSLQQRKLQPILKRMLQLGFRSKEGPTKGKEPANWSIVFHPLWQLTDLEQADRRLKIAQADAAYVQAQVVSPEEVAASRFGGDEYNGDSITVDLDSRAAIQKLDPEDPRPGPVDGVTRPPVSIPEGETGNKPPVEGTPAPKGSGALGFKENPTNPGSTDGEPI